MLDGVILYQGQFAARLTVSCMHRYMYMYFICDNASDIIWEAVTVSDVLYMYYLSIPNSLLPILFSSCGDNVAKVVHVVCSHAVMLHTSCHDTG